MEEKELAEVLSAWFKKHRQDTRYSYGRLLEIIFRDVVTGSIRRGVICQALGR